MLKVKPDTKGVKIVPKNPVSPAIPMVAVIARTAPARNGPIKGIAARISAADAPIAANIAAAAGPNCRKGIPTTTRSTSQLPPVRWMLRLKSAVNVIVPEWLTGIVTVGQFTQISGVHNRPLKGMGMQTRGRQKSGRMLLKSKERLKLSE